MQRLKTHWQSGPRGRNTILIVAVVLLLLLLCCLCGLITQLSPKKQTSDKATGSTSVAVAATQLATTQPTTVQTGPTKTTGPSNTPLPTSTPKPTDAPSATRTLAPTLAPSNTPQPIVLKGSGQTATNKITLPASVSVAAFTHSGSRNFVVTVYVGSKKGLLINEIGAYSGSRPISANEPIMLDIQADGAWTVTITPLSTGGTPAFSGKGDSVSALFTPPATGAWEIAHDGKANFAVWCRCSGGSDLVQNEIGVVSGSRVISFPKGPCYWEVEADGNWSLKPK